VIADLHWLIHQGHVIEFADGRMDTAKKPVPKPPKPEATKPAVSTAETSEPAIVPTETAVEQSTAETGSEDPFVPVASPAISPPVEESVVSGREEAASSDSQV
jgi:hypothetical protein